MSFPGMPGLALAVLLAVMPLPAMAADGIEGVLRNVAGGTQAPADLRVLYSDFESRDGGTSIQIWADGRFLRWDSERIKEIFATRQNEGRLEPARVALLFKLLLEIEAWHKLAQERRHVPDASLATLIIVAGAERSEVREWENDVPENRMERVREEMDALVPKGETRCILSTPHAARPAWAPASIATCKEPE